MKFDSVCQSIPFFNTCAKVASDKTNLIVLSMSCIVYGMNIIIGDLGTLVEEWIDMFIVGNVPNVKGQGKTLIGWYGLMVLNGAINARN